MQLRWSHAVVAVSDLDAMLDFYTGLLGFEVTDRGPLGGADSPEIVFMSQNDADHHQLAFVPLRADGTPDRHPVEHVAFRVDTLAEVKEMVRRVEADGRPTGIRHITHGNAWSVYFKDPEGNGIEIFCDSPWHVRQPQGRAWDPTADEAEVVEATRAEFESEPEFGPIEEFYERRRAHLETRTQDQG